MENLVRKAVIFFYTCFLLLISHSCHDTDEKCCKCLSAEGKSDAYLYPLTPDSPLWAELETGKAMYEVCLIPPGQLKDMCTHGVLDSWLTYPLLLNVFAWPTPQKGIDGVKEQFNGLTEFYRRPDAGLTAFNKYKTLDPVSYDPSWSSIEKGRFARLIAVLELTISQEAVLKTISSEERRELVKEALKKRALKENDPLYTPLANAFDVLIMGRVMMMEEFPAFQSAVTTDFEIGHFIESGEYVFLTGDPDPGHDLNAIIGIAQDFISM